MAELGDYVVQGRKKNMEVLVEMMDYTYVDKCADVAELRAILCELKDGKHGRYPHLEKHTQDKIMSLLPTKERSKIEALSREPTAADERDASAELAAFCASAHEDDDRLRTEVYVSAASARGPRLPPVRNKAGGAEETKAEPRAPASYLDEAAQPDKPDRISGYDFRSWDTFDVDAECDKVDADDRAKDAKNAKIAEDARRAEAAKARRTLAALEETARDLDVATMAPAERAFLAKREKNKGNEAYKAGEARDAYVRRSL